MVEKNICSWSANTRCISGWKLGAQVPVTRISGISRDFDTSLKDYTKMSPATVFYAWRWLFLPLGSRKQDKMVTR